MTVPLAMQNSDSANLTQENHCNATEKETNSGAWSENLASKSNAPGLSPASDFGFPDTSDETLYYRYGFKLTAVAAPLFSVDTAPALVGHFLGDPQWIQRSVVDPTSGRDIKDDISTFFGYLLKANKMEDVPAELYDLRQPGVAALRPSPIQLRWEIIERRTYYFLTPKNPIPDGTLESIAVRNAASAVEILRREWTTLEQVALNLVARGIAFNTFIRAPRPVSPPNRGPEESYRGLGYRHQDFQAQAGEYAGYEAVRSRIFSSGRGRVALLMGGVVARLARDVVSPQSVCCGPSKSVLVNGRCIWDGQHSSPAYWDDALTAEELDIICGVYEVATGQSDPHRPGGQQTKCASWWPTPAAWHGSGLNIGRWTPACEDWFQDRLAHIRAGDAPLHTLNQWKNNLVYDERCVPLSGKNDRLAEEFLVENGTRITRDPQTQFPRALRSRESGPQISSSEFYFSLRTQQRDSPDAECTDTEPPHPSASKPATEFPPQEKQALKPEIQQATRQYWDARRKVSSTLLRGRAIEQRLRALHVKSPDDIYLSSSELGNRLARVEAELAEERSRARQTEQLLHDIHREMKTPTVVPEMLEALIDG